MILENKKIIFIHIPKTGGNSFSHLLKEYSNDRLIKHSAYSDLINTFDIKGSITQNKHQSLQKYYEKLGKDLFNYKIVSIVRNPLHRMISLFYMNDRNLHPNDFVRKINHFFKKKFNKYIFDHSYYKYKKPKLDLDQFIKLTKEEISQTDYLSINGKYYENINIIKYENYNDEIKSFCSKNNIEYSKIHVNKGIKESFNPSLFQNLLSIIKKTHHNIDFEKFQYEN